MTPAFDPAGAGIGAAVGAATIPAVRAVLIRPPVSVPADAPTVSTDNSGRRTRCMLAVPVLACAVTGGRVGLNWNRRGQSAL